MACAKPSRPSDIRLQKFLASCGLGSRRACEQLIAAGRVAVDGQVVTTQGVRIDPARATVMLDGKPVAPQRFVYGLLNKPRGYICTCRDPERRDTILVLLPPGMPRLFPVGRLDCNSEGLLLLTNDGDWAQHIQHPRYVVEKEYQVWTDRALQPAETRRLRNGVTDDGECLRVSKIRRGRAMPNGACYHLALIEGRNRHIRRLLAAIGVRVTRLRRIRVGPVTLGTLAVGAYRPLTAREIAALPAGFAVRN